MSIKIATNFDMMSKKMSKMSQPKRSTSFSIYLLVSAFVLLANVGFAQISGPTSPAPGVSTNYSFNNGTIYPSPSWAITNGTIISSTSSGTYFQVTVQWSTSGAGTLSFKNRTTVISTLNVTVCSVPLVYSIGGGGNYCAGSGGVTITLSGSQSGVNYQLFVGAQNKSTLAGTGGALTWTGQTSIGNYTIVGTNASSGCASNMSGSVNVNTSALPTSYTVGGGGGYCSGSSGPTISLSGSEGGVNYQLQINGANSGGPIAGNGSALYWGGQTTQGTYIVIATNASTGCARTMSGSSSVTVYATPTIYSMGGGGSYCSGTGGVTVTLNGSQAGVNYQLRINGGNSGSPVGGTGGSLSWAGQTSGGTYTVVATNASTGCASTMSGSASVTENTMPSTYTVGGGGSYCQNGAGLSITLNGSRDGTNYQLKFNGSNVGSPLAGSTGNTLTWPNQTSAGNYTVQAIVAASGCSSTMSGTASIAINPLPLSYSIGGGGSYCSGGSGVTVSLGSSQAGVEYQLKINGTNAGFAKAGTGAHISWASQTTAGNYTIVATDATTGCTQAMSGTTAVSINPLPAVSTVTGGGNFCSGGSGVNISLGASQTGVNYQLKVGGSNTGTALAGTNGALSWANQTTAGVYTVLATNASTSCSQAMSSSATVAVNPVPVTYTTSGGGSICSGASGLPITLNGSESTVNYQLKINGVNSGSPITGNGSTLNWPTQTTQGTYTIVGTIASSGCSTTMTGSPSITVNPTPSVFTVNGGGSFCSGGAGLTVGLTGSQTGVNYQLKLGGANSGSPVAGTNGALSWPNRTSAGTYTVVATSGAGCTQTMSASAVVVVNTLPIVYAVSGGGEFCSQESGMQVKLLQSQVGVNYQLKLNGAAIGNVVAGMGPEIYWQNQTAEGTYTVQATNASTGCSQNMSASATIVVRQSPQISLSGTPVLVYGKQPVTLSTTGTYYSYQWKNNGVDISGATSQNWVADRAGQITVSVKSSVSSIACLSSPQGIVTNTGSQPAPVNFVSSTRILKEGLTSNTSLYSLTAKEVSQTISYQDGIGRTFQTVGVGMSGDQKDLVVPIAYGKQGLADTTYLPYATDSKDGRFRLFAIRNSSAQYSGSEQASFYTNANKVAHDNFPYARTIHRQAPDARVVEQGAPGADWQPGTNHTVKNEVILNTVSYPVLRWNADGTSTGSYPVGKVMMSSTTDENGNLVRSYTNAQGQLVLKQVEAATGVWLQTYYVYDVYGRLKYQVSPKAVSLLDDTPNLEADLNLSELIYKYTYDSIGRVVETKVPGAAVQYTVYDKLGRVVLTQDANQRASNQWLAIKYDYLNRPVYSGLYTNTTQTTRVAVQKLFTNATGPYYEKPEVNSTYHGYSSIVFPTNISPLTFNYYDSYDFDRNGSADYTYNPSDYPSATQTSLRGLATGSKKLILGTTNWLVSVVFYDTYDRPIQTQSNNHKNLAVQDRTSVLYDFAGHMLETKSTHNGGTTVSVRQRYTYDDTWRTIAIHHSINGSAEQQVVAYEYNALGQVVDKKLHLSNGGTTWLQSVDLRYSIRGWLKSINNAQLVSDGTTNDENNDYFGMELLYNTPASESGLGNTPYYNGNISAIKWKEVGTGSGAVESDRLATSTFKAATSTGWNKHVGAFNENMSYDVNGNINTLSRSAKDSLGNITTIDNLSYTYSVGNQLSKVEDMGTQDGFLNGKLNGTQEYAYNAAGQLTKDENKNISSIHYNNLGKVQQVVFTNGKTVNYSYDATGVKLGISVIKGVDTTTTDYVGGFVYENDNLAFFSSPEGRIVKNGSNYEYQYAIADHQGNTRIVFSSAIPTPDAPVATLETANENSEAAKFLKYEDVRKINFGMFDHTNSAATKYAVRLSGSPSETYGLARSVAVAPGDKIKAEVFAKYVDPNSSNWTTTLNDLMTAIANGTTAPGTIIDGGFYGLPSASSIPFAGLLVRDGDNGTGPKAYLNWLVFDKTFEPIPSKSGYKRITEIAKESGTDIPHEKLEMPEITFAEAGYIYIYLSNENGTPIDVYFDDFKVTHTPTNIIQYNEYYPFGLQTVNSWSRDEDVTSNNFLYNGGSELNNATNNYEMFFREYDPAIGRMNAVDPMANKYSSLTPYNYSYNNPIVFNDPSGADPAQDNLDYLYYREARAQADVHASRYQGTYVYNSLRSLYNLFSSGLRGTISQWNPNFYGPIYLGQDEEGKAIYELPTNIGKSSKQGGVWISVKGSFKVRYSNGAFYKANGKLYEGSTKFLKQVSTALKFIETTSIGRVVLSVLMNSDNKFIITQAKSNRFLPQSESNINTLKADLLNNANAFTLSSDNFAKLDRIGAGGTVYWNPGGTPTLPGDGGAPSNSTSNLFHELAHAFDSNNGDLSYNIFYGTNALISYGEARAVFFENTFRLQFINSQGERVINTLRSNATNNDGVHLLINGEPLIVLPPSFFLYFNLN